jgi:hypothetical protein
MADSRSQSFQNINLINDKRPQESIFDKIFAGQSQVIDAK